MLLSIKIVFSSWIYIVLAGAVASIFWIIFNIFDQLLFFSPVCILPTMRCIRRLCPFKHNCDSSGHHGEHEHICAQTFAQVRYKFCFIFLRFYYQRNFKHMHKLFFTGLSSCFRTWRSRVTASIYNPFKLSDAASHSLNSTSNIGILFYKQQVN